MVAAVGAIGTRDFSIKNTFIHFEDKELGRTESDIPPARAESDPTGQAYVSATRPINVQFATDPLREDEEDGSDDDAIGLERTQTHVPGGHDTDTDKDDEDDDDGGMLARSNTHVPGEPMYIPTAISDKGKSSQPHGFSIKNTFVHVDDTDVDKPLRRTGSDVPPARTCSDPPIARDSSSAQPKRLASVSEETSNNCANQSLYEADEDEEDADEELQTLQTYDPFTMSSPTSLSAAPLTAMPATDVSSSANASATAQSSEGEEENDCEEDGATLERANTFDPFSAAEANPVVPAPMITPTFGLTPMPFGYLPIIGMMPCPCPVQPQQLAGEDKTSAVEPRAEFADGPPVGGLHRFHKEVHGFGSVSPDYREFTKSDDFEGRLSVLTSHLVEKGGTHRYLVQFTAGEMSKADGVGFVFAPRLPCAKNIQKIVSVFVNQRGRICMRVCGELIRARAHVRTIRVGDWVELVMDLDSCIAAFNVWPANPRGFGPPLPGKPDSTAEFHYGRKLAQASAGAPKPIKLNVGHLAVVVQNVGVTVTLGS